MHERFLLFLIVIDTSMNLIHDSFRKAQRPCHNYKRSAERIGAHRCLHMHTYAPLPKTLALYTPTKREECYIE